MKHCRAPLQTAFTFSRCKIPAPESPSASPSPWLGHRPFPTPAVPHTAPGTDAACVHHPAPHPIASRLPNAAAPSSHAHFARVPLSVPRSPEALAPEMCQSARAGTLSRSRSFTFQCCEGFVVHIPLLQDRENRLRAESRPRQLPEDSRYLLLVFRLFQSFLA